MTSAAADQPARRRSGAGRAAARASSASEIAPTGQVRRRTPSTTGYADHQQQDHERRQMDRADLAGVKRCRRLISPRSAGSHPPPARADDPAASAPDHGRNRSDPEHGRKAPAPRAVRPVPFGESGGTPLEHRRRAVRSRFKLRSPERTRATAPPDRRGSRASRRQIGLKRFSGHRRRGLYAVRNVVTATGGLVRSRPPPRVGRPAHRAVVGSLPQAVRHDIDHEGDDRRRDDQQARPRPALGPARAHRHDHDEPGEPHEERLVVGQITAVRPARPEGAEGPLLDERPQDQAAEGDPPERPARQPGGSGRGEEPAETRPHRDEHREGIRNVGSSQAGTAPRRAPPAARRHDRPPLA